MKKTVEQIEYLKSVRFNPLVDYWSQTKGNIRPIETNIGKTSLRNNIMLPMVGIDDKTDLHIFYDANNYKFSQVVSTAKNRDLLLLLAPGAQSLFIWILFNLKFRSDTITILYDKVIKTGLTISRGTFNKAIKELENIKVIKRVGIKRTEDYWVFFINCQILWKGNAKLFFQDVLEVHPEYLKRSVKKK
jgi:hypothetical protein